jgi:O-antigen/teichoic acid export membrane protein
MFSDRIILAHFGMLDEVGLYSLAAQIAILIFIINDAITKVQGPIAMSGLTDNVIEAKSRMSQFVTGYFFIITIGFISLILFSRELLYTFTSPEYYRAYLIVPILAGVYVLSGFYRVFTNIISFHNATCLISLAAFIQAIANLLLNFLLIPIFGMFAAAFSTLFSMFLYTAFIFFTSQKLDKIDIDYKTIFKVFAFLLFYLVLGIFIDSVLEVGLVLFILKFLLLASLIICFLYFKINLKYRVKFFNLLSNIVKKIMASKLSDR